MRILRASELTQILGQPCESQAPGLGAFLPAGAAVVDGGAHHGETLRTMQGARHAAQTRALGHGLEHNTVASIELASGMAWEDGL